MLKYTKEIENIMVFAGSNENLLTSNICKNLDMKVSECILKKFSDGEIYINLKENVSNKTVIFVKSTRKNDDIIELLIFLDAAKRNNAKQIIAVIPYFGYARQDRIVKNGETITSSLIAKLIKTSGATSVITADLHSPQIEGFFDIPIWNLSLNEPFLNHYNKLDKSKTVVVSPDSGSVKRSRNFAINLEMDLVIIEKNRPNVNVSEILSISGNVKENVIIIDDMLDTGGTIINSAETLLKLGAKNIYVSASHGVCSGMAIKNLSESLIKEICFSNTINLNETEVKNNEKFKILDSSKIFANTLKKYFNI